MSRRNTRFSKPNLEQLESRLAPVVGATAIPAPVLPGAGYDGVVMVTNPGGGLGTGSLLFNGRHILTAAHNVDGNDDGEVDPGIHQVLFQLPGGNVTINVPAANILIHPSYRTATGVNSTFDLALMRLPAIRPFGAEEYSLYKNSNEKGRTFTIVGYGRTGTGVTGAVAGTSGTKRSGTNQVGALEDLSVPVFGSYRRIRADFDNTPAINATPPTSVDRLGDGAGLGANEVSSARGDSGGPWFINGLIAGVHNEGTNANGDGIPSNFSDTFSAIRVYAFSDWIEQNLDNPYDLVLDMNTQVLGANGVVENVTISVNRRGNLLELWVLREGDAQWNRYWVEAASNVRSLTILGSDDNETIRLEGPIGINTNTIDGRGGNNTLQLDYSRAGDASYAVNATNVTRGAGTINYAGVSALTLTTGGQADTIDVRGTAAGVVTTVNAGGGNDTIRIGNVHNRLDGIHVTVNGGAGRDSLTITNEGWPGAETHTLTDTTYTINPPHGLVATYGGMEIFALRCGSGTDTVNVRATDRNTAYTISTGGGTNTVNVGWDNTMAFVRGSVLLTGSGTDRVFFNNQANPARGNYTLSSVPAFLTTYYTMTIGGLGPVGYRNFSYVEVNAGDAAVGDTIAVEATDLAATTQVNAGDGADDVFVTNKSNRLDGIRVSINGQGGNDTLSISNVGWSGAETYTITATTFSILPPHNLIATFVSVENLELNTGSGRDVVNVTNTPTGTTTVRAGGGNDDVVVTGASGRLDLSGQGGNDRFVFRNFTRTANVYGGGGDDTIESAQGPLATSQVPFETVETLLISGGSTLTFDTDVATEKVLIQNGTADVRNRTLTLRAGAAHGVQVQQNGILSGTGTIRGTVSNGGEVRPGGDGAVGQLVIRGDYVQTGQLNDDLQGPGVGTQSDNLDVIGRVQLAGTLSVNALAGFDGNLFELITNNGTDAVTGTFGGLAEGANVAVGGRQFQISYRGGTGNDVVLRQVIQVGTATTVSSSAQPSVYGQAVTFTATVTPATPGSGAPTGLVQFQVNGVNFGAPVALLANGTATSSGHSALAVGSHTITAVYSGDSNFAPSTSAPLTQVVNKAATRIGLSVNPNPIVYGQTMGFQFLFGVLPPGSGTPTGTATVTATFNGVTRVLFTTTIGQGGGGQFPPLEVGTHTLAITYNGDGNYLGSTSLPYAMVVNPASTTTTLTASSTTISFGQPLTLSVNVAVVAPGGGTPTGTVTIYGTLNGVETVLTSGPLGGSLPSFPALAVGTHSLRVVYSGDGNFQGSFSIPLTIVVNP